MSQPDLFTVSYPDAAGWKARDTSRQAAQAMTKKVKPLRDRVLAEIRRMPGTPEEIARELNEPVMNVRPRCSELAAVGLIEDSGKRGEAMGGRRSIVWRPVDEQRKAA